jgi:hypothetical protein
MSISEAFTGTATISTTEYSLVTNSTTLTTNTTRGVYQIYIDFANMQSGDEYLVQIKERVISGGTQRLIYSSTVEGAQSTPFVTPTLVFFHGWDVTVDLITGSARSISWSIRRVG